MTTAYGYEFNKNRVCINPSRPVYEHGTGWYYSVETAQMDDGRWVYGLHTNTADTSWGSPCCHARDGCPWITSHDTEADAIAEALVKIEKWARAYDQPDPHNSDKQTQIQVMLKRLQKHKQPKQLSLF